MRGGPRTPIQPAPYRPALANGPTAPGRPSSGPGGGGTPLNKKKDTCLEQIQLLQKKREERRKSMEEKRAERAAEEKRLTEQGLPGDVDFQRMIRVYREERGPVKRPHIPPGDLKICICVRKRPINEKEKRKKDYDSVTCANPVVMVHDCKLRVDGITKYLDNTGFAFDHTFAEEDTTEELYSYTAAPLIPHIFRQGRATCFAYGQTGSGKTFTMAGIQLLAARDIFKLLGRAETGVNLSVFVSFFEIYGGRCQDLLNNRHRLIVREDGKGDVVVSELEELEASTEEQLLFYIDQGNRNRTTHATEVNDMSSRSHAVCQIVLRNRENGRVYGKLSLVDLAGKDVLKVQVGKDVMDEGSERGADTKSHNRQRRLESAEINKSLLALKECIRALDNDSVHVPYRASKLTMVLKDCFTRESSRTVMIATVSPNASSSDHTLNTLRYADRVKEKNAADLPQEYEGMRDDSPQARQNLGLEQEALDYEEDDPTAGDEDEERILAEERKRHPFGMIEAVGKRVLRGGARVDEKERKAGIPDGAKQPKVSLPCGLEELDKAADDDIEYIHQSLRRSNRSSAETDDVEELHRAVQTLFEDEEALLNSHMNVIQENAELLTEEGRLLQSIQGDAVVDYDIDTYTARLEQILDRKLLLITTLRQQLASFRRRLQDEEAVSQRIAAMPQY